MAEEKQVKYFTIKKIIKNESLKQLYLFGKKYFVLFYFPDIQAEP